VRAAGLEDVPAPVEVHREREVEVLLALCADDGGEVEDVDLLVLQRAPDEPAVANVAAGEEPAGERDPDEAGPAGHDSLHRDVTLALPPCPERRLQR
jgi:hypothetical protein